MANETPEVVIPSFGGGLNLDAHPAAIRDDQWTECDGFMPLRGCAEQWPNWSAYGAPINAGTGDLIGVVEDAFDDDFFLVGLEVSNILRLFKFDKSAATVSEVTRSGGTNDPRANNDDILCSAFLNSYQVLSGGMQNTLLSRSGLVRYAGGATYDTIDPPGGEELRPQQVVSFGGHLVVGGCLRFDLDPNTGGRTLAWSSANNESLWAPALDNDAGWLVLDDVTGPVTALLLLGPGMLGIFSRGAIHAFIPTGTVPPFRREPLSVGRGCQFMGSQSTIDRRRLGIYGQTDIGAVVLSADDLYLMSGGEAQPLLGPILHYFFAGYRGLGASADPRKQIRPILYHPTWNQLLVPRPHPDPGEVLTMERGTGAWGKMTFRTWVVGADDPIRHGIIVRPSAHQWVWGDDGNQLWLENAPSTGYPNATVATKDFAVGGRSIGMNRLILDWECLNNGVTDAIEVSIATRDDLNPATLASRGRDISPSYAVVGTLSGGATELPVRVTGKYLRLKFRVTSGRVRIRGLKLRPEDAGPRRASVA